MAEQKNTKIYYLYRDADNYKTSNEEVLSGVITPKQKNTIINCLDSGEMFIPSQVGLDDLQEELQQYDSKDWDVDHCWHELEKMHLTLTDEEPTIEMTIDELVENFKKAKNKWNDNVKIGHILDKN